MSILHRGIYYSPPPSAPDEWFATHYAEGTVPSGTHFDAIKGFNPSFLGYTYKSATDDYTPDATLAASCAATGIDVETCYQHWDEPTVMQYGSTQRAFNAGDRIPVYQPSTRTLCSFVPSVRPARKDMIQRLLAVTSPAGRLWDGMWLDNCAPRLYNFGTLISGGRTQESGQVIGTPAYHSWHWQNLRDWVKELRAAIAPKLLAINVANLWAEDALTMQICDRVFQEFIGNPIHDTYPAISEVARRHRVAQANGIGMWTSASAALGTPAETYQEMQYATLCMHLVVQQPLSSTHIQNGNGPFVSNWPDLVISPVEVNHQFTLLGTPTSDDYVWASGIDGAGHSYEIRARDYSRGAALARILSPWNGATDEIVQIPRPANMTLIGPDGTNSTPATLSIKNGGGAILFH